MAGLAAGAPPTIKPLAVTINGVTTNFTFDTTGMSQFSMGWVTHAMAFVATGASSTINFVSDVGPSGGTLNAGAALDNVRVAPLGGGTPVPLSWGQSAAMLLLIASGTWYLRRRG